MKISIITTFLFICREVKESFGSTIKSPWLEYQGMGLALLLVEEEIILILQMEILVLQSQMF